MVMSSRLKQFVNDYELWNSFLEELDREIADQHRTLERVPDKIGMFRTQGRIEALKKLKKLRDKVNGHKTSSST